MTLGGKKIFDSLKDKDCIIMAANVRIFPGIARGIMRAAKDTDSPVIFELAKSESDLKGGYTGQTPEIFAKNIKQVAGEVGYDCYAIHADHIGIKKGDDEEIKNIKLLVEEQINQGYTSFAIDASHIFNFKGTNTFEELKGNIEATEEIAKFIDHKYPGDDFGLEAEVGEIGKKDNSGMVVTTPDEATIFISELNKRGVFPDLLAIANGSAHGNTYVDGKLVEQVSIDIPQTKKIAQELRDKNLNVRIAQHGITGTPRDMIAKAFPRGDVLKGNVGTFWQNLAFRVIKLYEPELYDDIWKWTMENHKSSSDGKSEEEVFGKSSKHALKVFYDRINGMKDETKHAIESLAYAESLMFMKAFNSYEKASIVRKG